MKYELEIGLSAVKHMVVEAEDEEEALEMAEEIFKTTTIPVSPEDLPEIYVNDVFPYEYDNYEANEIK